MSSRTIYIVFGKTGEYSDRFEWPVTAYEAEDDAKAHVAKASEYAKRWKAFRGTDEYIDMDYGLRCEKEKSSNPMDPQFSMDYTGTEYWYHSTQLQVKFVDIEVTH